MCLYYFLAPPNIFHNFVSFHSILMFLTILESGDKTNNIGDEFKTIRLILINTYRYLGSFYSFSDMKTYFGFTKQILFILWHYSNIIWLRLSFWLWTKVITLSSFHCIISTKRRYNFKMSCITMHYDTVFHV